MTKLDVLAFGAHPDDVELGVGGTILHQVKLDRAVGIVDLTRGELGTRGDVGTRMKEAQWAGAILGVKNRQNLELADGFFEINEQSRIKVIEQIRRFQPGVVLAPAMSDRHPDHGRAGKLVSEACFLSGLEKIATSWGEDQKQKPWRPAVVYHYIQDRYTKPDIVVDITPYFDGKVDAIKAFASQFYDPESEEADSPISGPEFMDFIRGRSLDFGRLINTLYGEGFTTERAVGTQDLLVLK